MKKLIFLIVIYVGLNSCSKTEIDDTVQTSTFVNTSISDVKISFNDSNIEPFILKKGETITKDFSEYFFLINIEPLNSTEYIFDFDLDDDKYIIISYQYLVRYEITGTAKTVDVTLNNSNGGTSQYSNVTLPKSYKYSTFNDDFLYISAQNNDKLGSVTVSIYYKDKLFKTSTSSGAYVIATASGSAD